MKAEFRPMKTDAESALSASFAAAKSALPGKDAVAALREDAFRRFELQGLPSRRVEDWKYTDLRAAMREALPLAAPPDAAAQAAAVDAGALLAGLEARPRFRRCANQSLDVLHLSRTSRHPALRGSHCDSHDICMTR